MTFRTVVRWLLIGSSLLVLPLNTGRAQPRPAPTDAEVRERIQQLERKNEPAQLETLQWLQKHAAVKNAGLAIPALERTIRDDPVGKVRESAVLALSDVARKQKLPCPLALVQAIFDDEFSVRQDAAALITQFTAFAPGTVELAFRAAWSNDANVRSCGLHLLALAAPRDEKALAVIETAKNDRSFLVRHNSHCFKFQASDRLEEYLVWLIRLQEDDSVLDPVPNNEELRKQEECNRNLAIIASARSILEWCDKRPDELAAALVQLLDHKSSVVRHGAVRLIGATAVKTDPPNPKSGDVPLSKVPAFLFPKSGSGPLQPGSQPKPRLEKSKVAPFLEKRKVRERLQKLSDSDPDRAVQGAALLTLDRFARLQEKP
jgi:hypothetical protein